MKKSFMSKRLTLMKFDQIKRNATAYSLGNIKGLKVYWSLPMIKGDLGAIPMPFETIRMFYGIRSNVARLLKAIEVPAPVLPPMETCWLPN